MGRASFLEKEHGAEDGAREDDETLPERHEASGTVREVGQEVDRQRRTHRHVVVVVSISALHFYLLASTRLNTKQFDYPKKTNKQRNKKPSIKHVLFSLRFFFFLGSLFGPRSATPIFHPILFH